VLSRGNERREIFYNDADRILFLETLGEMAERDVLIYTLWRLGAFTNRQIGEVFGLTGAAVGQRIALMKSKRAADPSTQRQLAKLKWIILTWPPISVIYISTGGCHGFNPNPRG
jgi:hypothetical protein